jgi:hypothetical protein
MKKLIPNLMAALAAAGLIALAGCDAVPEDPDAAGNAAGETVDGNESEENPAPIDLKTEPKTEKKKDKGPGDDTPPDEKE